MNKKTWIFIGVVIAFLIGVITLIVILNKPKNLINKTKVVEGIKFSDAKIDKLSDKYVFYVTVTTENKETIKVTDFDAVIYDAQNNRIGTLTGYIGDIDNKSKKEISIESTEDLSNAYEINYTIRLNND